MSTIWRIENNEVFRKNTLVAKVFSYGDSWAWSWIEDGDKPFRSGFATHDGILDDVKYFYRYNPPALVLTFKSGRKVTYR